MVSVLLLFAFAMSPVINFVERTIYNDNSREETISREEVAEADVASNPE